MRAVEAYYRRVIGRATRDAWRFGRGHVVFALLVLAAGLGLGLLMGEASLATLVLYPLATLGGACVLLFVGSLVLAPVRLDAEPRPARADARKGAISALDTQRLTGQELLEALTSPTNTPADPVAAVDAWLEQTEAALEEHTHGQMGRFLSDAGLADVEDRRLSSYMQRRMQRLDEIINALHFPGAEGLLSE